MAEGLLAGLFRKGAPRTLGRRIADVRQRMEGMHRAGFAGGSGSVIWKGLAEEEKTLLELQAQRHLKALQLAEEGRLEEALALHERNVADEFLLAAPYEVVAMHYARQGRRVEACAVLEQGIRVFENLVPPTQDDREATLRALRQKLQRLAPPRAE